MSIEISYAPLNEILRKGKQFDIYARIKFTMFKELENEFSPEEYPALKDIKFD